MRSRVLREIESLDARKDNQSIVRSALRRDFPFDTTRALELALFRTFAIPSISAILDKTGEFKNRTQFRYDDTDILVSELMEHGYDSERGRVAITRLNAIHGRFAISNRDFLYVLSTFIFEPIRWIDRFGWRKLSAKEREALFCFWGEVGQRMGMLEIPQTLEQFEAFNQFTERERFAFSESNQRVGNSTLGLFCGWFPRPVRGLVRAGMLSIMDKPLLTAMGFKTPPGWYRGLVLFALKSRAVVLKFWPRRSRPLLRTEMRKRSYPGGYAIDRIGPLA